MFFCLCAKPLHYTAIFGKNLYTNVQVFLKFTKHSCFLEFLTNWNADFCAELCLLLDNEMHSKIKIRGQRKPPSSDFDLCMRNRISLKFSLQVLPAEKQLFLLHVPAGTLSTGSPSLQKYRPSWHSWRFRHRHPNHRYKLPASGQSATAATPHWQKLCYLRKQSI